MSKNESCGQIDNSIAKIDNSIAALSTTQSDLKLNSKSDCSKEKDKTIRTSTTKPETLFTLGSKLFDDFELKPLDTNNSLILGPDSEDNDAISKNQNVKGKKFEKSILEAEKNFLNLRKEKNLEKKKYIHQTRNEFLQKNNKNFTSIESNQELEIKIKQLEKENGRLNDKLMDAEMEGEKIKKQLTEYENEKTDYERNTRTLEAAITSKNNEINKNDQQLNILYNELNKKEEEINSLKSQLAIERSNIKNAKNKIDEQIKVIEHKNCQIEIYDQKMKYAENVFEDIRNDSINKDTRIKLLNDELSTKNETIIQLNKQVKILEDEIQSQVIDMESNDHLYDIGKDMKNHYSKSDLNDLSCHSIISSQIQMNDNIFFSRESSKNKNNIDKSGMIKCFVCKKECKGEWGLGVHINKAHPEYSEIKIPCSDCGQSMKGYFGLVVHRKTCVRKSEI